MKPLFRFFAISLLSLLFFLPGKVFAQTPGQQFSTNYDVTYAVDNNGLTTVTEKITLQNLTAQYYASSFSLLISATDVENVNASDFNGNLTATTNKEKNETRINIAFPEQITGQNKTYSFNLEFTSTDFAQKQGKVWQVSIPKISNPNDVSAYNLTLMVPDSFGDPGSILPEPLSQSDTGGTLNYTFSKDQLKDIGILANFGLDQLFNFNLTYHITNTNILPTVKQISIPADTDYQQTQINSIDPKPDNVTIDGDGNYIGWFKLSRLQSEDVRVTGISKLYINSQSKLPSLLSDQSKQLYTQQQKYWESDNPLVQAKLSDVFKNGTPSTNLEKARAINNYVVNTLTFDTARYSQGNFARIGGLTALINPNNALDSEFSDLFVALARAEGIPARELVGYAYSNNKDLRPTALDGTLHVWPEYYDSTLGWVMIDPTWQNTSGGVDYFSKFDLSHFVIATRGISSTDPLYPSSADVSFSDSDFNPHPVLEFHLDAPSSFFAGFPATLGVNIENSGSSLQLPAVLSVKASKIDIPDNTTFTIPKIAPFGHLQYNFDLRTSSLFASFDDIVTLTVGNQSVQQAISVRPFFTFKLFPLMVILALGLIAFVYLTVLGLHLYQHKEKYFKGKKTKND